MDVDKALEVMASRGYPGWYDDVFYAGPVLAAEVKRLRSHLADEVERCKRWKDIAVETDNQLAEAWSELAAIYTKSEKPKDRS